MTDRPIIFSAPMVQALLAGRKTQTRRILKPQPFSNGFHFDGRDIACHNDYLPPAALLMRRGSGTNAYTISDLEDGPEGMSGYFVGDRMWVREATVRTHFGTAYIADGTAHYGAGGRLPTTPSIHMPRRASRLTLTVKEVRIQPVQAINRGDAMEEGCPFWNMAKGDNPCDWFRDLWNTINGAGAWDSNPYVAAISFTVEQRNIDA